MKSRGHFVISVVKSIIRLISSTASLVTMNLVPMALGFAIAEILGILEEIVDKR